MLVGAAAYWILALDARRSILFGALPIVTGPTVVLPLLRHVQPVGSVRSILKWEGILDDPVGAIIAVLIIGAPRRARAVGDDPGDDDGVALGGRPPRIGRGPGGDRQWYDASHAVGFAASVRRVQQLS